MKILYFSAIKWHLLQIPMLETNRIQRKHTCLLEEKNMFKFKHILLISVYTGICKYKFFIYKKSESLCTSNNYVTCPKLFISLTISLANCRWGFEIMYQLDSNNRNSFSNKSNNTSFLINYSRLFAFFSLMSSC